MDLMDDMDRRKILDSCLRRNGRRAVGRYMRHGVRTEEEKMDSRLRGNDRRAGEWYMGTWYEGGGRMVGCAHPAGMIAFIDVDQGIRITYSASATSFRPYP